MSEFKTCAYCGVANGFRCQQCYDMEDYVYDEEKALEHKDFEDEVRADERANTIDELKGKFIERLGNDVNARWKVSAIIAEMCIMAEQLKEQKSD